MKKFLTLSFVTICAVLSGMAQTYIQYVDSADNYIKRENWEAAERMTIAALRLKPANKLNYLLWSNLGDIRTRQQNYEGALEAFEIALASAPRKELILNNRAYSTAKPRKLLPTSIALFLLTQSRNGLCGLEAV